MAGIKSIVEMIYDSRDNKSGMIEIEIQGWQYNSTNRMYNTTVVDSVVTTQMIPVPGPPEEPPIEQEVILRTIISRRETQYQKDQVDALFTQHGDPIDPTESLTDQMDIFLSAAFLYVTQQNPVYRVASTGQISTADDWIIK